MQKTQQTQLSIEISKVFAPKDAAYIERGGVTYVSCYAATDIQIASLKKIFTGKELLLVPVQSRLNIYIKEKPKPFNPIYRPHKHRLGERYQATGGRIILLIENFGHDIDEKSRTAEPCYRAWLLGKEGRIRPSMKNRFPINENQILKPFVKTKSL